MKLSIIVVASLMIVSVRAFTSAQRKFQHETLQQHNSLRKRHCAAPLQLDDKLSKRAQADAENLAKTNKLKHGKSNLGENLFTMISSTLVRNLSGSRPTQSWYNEIKLYSFTRPVLSKKTGHFTQVVWKGTKRLGVGVAFAKGGHKAVVVAYYFPSGNYPSQLAKNVARATC